MPTYRKLNGRPAKILKNGGIGVIPTDTIYGVSGPALSRTSIMRIYKLRKRDLKKPMIILIGSLKDLEVFVGQINPATKAFLKQYWPGKISVVLPCTQRKFFYLHRGTKALAFRMPARKSLRELVQKVGPLVSTSANFEGMPPARTVQEARDYFGDKVDFYVDIGKLESEPSTLVSFASPQFKILREGAVKISQA